MDAVDLPFALVEAKLAAPSTRPGTVAKTDVIARLCESRQPFATMIAPAGYGKTTLLAHWAEADARPFGWVALDGRDDDGVMLLRYVATAVHRVEPLPPAVFDALTGLGTSIWPKRIPPIGNALAAVETPLVLVLDDLHAVANPDCLDALAALLEYVPAGSQIAVASREAPALPVARWRTQGRVHEIGVADLRMDEQEAVQLLHAAGVELDATELTDLTQHTEGWPAGLYLAALSRQAGGSGTAQEEAFGGDDRFVSDYFRLELLSRLPEPEVRFLTHTSVLEQMCGSLCDAVLETRESARTLESLERKNSFVVPLDRRGEWYRYHHLFRQLLLTELERGEPEELSRLNRQAMAWCLANDLLEEAVMYGHRAGETDTVAGLLDKLALPLYYDGRMDTVERWLGWFGDEQLARYPALAVYGAWIHAMTGHAVEAGRCLSIADGATSTIPLSDGSASIEPWVATLRAVMMPRGAEPALAEADLALSQFPPRSDWRPTAHAIRGIVYALLGAVDDAKADLTATIETGSATGAAVAVFVAQAQLALLAAEHGAWGEAGRHARAAQAIVEERGLGEYSFSGLAHVAEARVAVREGRHDDARAALAGALRIWPLLDHGMPWLAVQVGLELARASLALGEAATARTVLAETEEVLRHRPDLGLLVERTRELRQRADATSGAAGAWAMSLTRAELRLLPYLATHLTFPEIATRLFITRNTVKTEALSIYRKLGASSRSEAIERAVAVGLLESSVYPQRADLRQR